MLLANQSWGPMSGPPALLVHGACDSRTTWAELGPWLAEYAAGMPSRSISTGMARAVLMWRQLIIP